MSGVRVGVLVALAAAAVIGVAIGSVVGADKGERDSVEVKVIKTQNGDSLELDFGGLIVRAPEMTFVRADMPDLTVKAEAGKVAMKGKGGATLSAESMKIPYRRKSAKDR